MRLPTFITVIFVVVTMSWQARAASIGDINVFSALNQPLKAEIPIKLNNPNELHTLKVSIAPDPELSDTGISGSPEDLTLQLTTNHRGNPIIALSTHTPIVEPAMSIFVLLETNDSRMLREYTLLLDFPSSPSPAAVENTEHTQTTMNHATSPGERTTVSPSHTPHVSSQHTHQEAAFPLVYTPARNETLWSIASKLRTNERISVQVMLKAIADANPEAFNHQNINSLKSGFTLNLPDKTAIASITHKQAVDFIKSQNIQWQQRVESKPSQTILPHEQPAIMSSPVAETAAVDISESKEEENKALRDKIALLESQLTTLESLLNDVNSQIDHQQSVITSAGNAIGDESHLSVTDDNEGFISPIEQLQEAAPVAVENQTDQESTQHEVEKTFTSNQAIGAISPSIEPAKPAMLTSSSGPTSQTSSIFDKLTSVDGIMKLISENNYFIAMGAALLLLIGIFTTYRAKRNAEQMASHAVSPSQEYSYTEEDVPPVESLDVEESIENESLDRMVEIDVYLAYGRYKEAEILAGEGIAENPQCAEYYLKLFEIYKASDNTVSFEAEAESFYSSLGTEHPEIWEKIVAMGKELCSNHPLFLSLEEDNTPETDDEVRTHENTEQHHAIDSNNEQESAPVLEGETGTIHPSDDNGDDNLEKQAQPEDENIISEDTSSLNTTSTQDNNVEHKPISTTVDINEHENTVSADNEGVQALTQQNDTVADSINHSYSNDKEHQPTLEISEPGSPSTDDEFSLELAEEHSDAEEILEESASFDSAELDEIPQKTTEADKKDSPHPDAAPPPANDSIADNPTELTEDFLIESGAAEFVNDSLDQFMGDDEYLDNDPMEQLNDTVAALEEIESQGEAFVDSTYDQEAVETKLDLVRAYIEMDDRDEARRILDEILTEGNDDQKSQAETLKQEIA